MQRFVELRQWTGRDYGSQARNLGYFDRFLSLKRWKSPWITAEIINRYRVGLAGLCPTTQRCRMPAVRRR
jgi:hypothetical protein